MAENMENQQYAFLKDWSTEELEQLLREDTYQDSTNQKMVDFALEVLLEREGYTKAERASLTQKAWDDFQKHYNIPEGQCRELYPMFSEKKESNHWIRFAHLRRVSIAAALILILTLGATQVLGLENILTIIGHWTNNIFYFIKYGEQPENVVEISSYSSDNAGLMKLWESLNEHEVNNVILPTWLPERYSFLRVDYSLSDTGTQLFSGTFENNGDQLLFQIRVIDETEPFLYEKDYFAVEKYTYAGLDFYMMNNLDFSVCNWALDNWECSISGKLSMDEIIQIINSIE